MPPTFTVFTPTFDRASTLPRVHAALARQTCQDFEWLIVDDGSRDGTRELVAAWARSSPFAIRYQWQENAGKHVAFNRGVAAARGELFLPFDSDDDCVAEALERFLHHWGGIDPAERASFSGISCLCADPAGAVVGDRFPADVYDSDALEVHFRRRIRGEKWGFHRTAVLRDYPFPEPPGVRFIAEGVVWLRIAASYRMRFVNEALRIYHHEPGPGALSHLSPKVVPGRLLYHRVVLDEFIDWLPSAPLEFTRSALNAARYAWDVGEGPLAQLRAVRRWRARALVLAAMPAGLALSLRDRLAFRRGR